MDLTESNGFILDGKYKIDRELGRGGMGSVFLAIHVGTERSVAVKVISPQYMRKPEFVERFRREARAAGRLRHPNVVDVTDFGFAESPDGSVAYIVMEYLDGCTLGEVLEEEKKLPVGWTLDILEQVCSAVHEAHQQGIIHRDLKPDNIWLEPNQRGGYTVKVLDFGIAKLEENCDDDSHAPAPNSSITPTDEQGVRATLSDAAGRGTTAAFRAPTAVSDAPTLMQTDQIFEEKTILFPAVSDSGGKASGGDGVSADFGQIDLQVGHADSDGSLTRVGAVLGTPLYMSPEQCRGDHLDARSDVYSLGVIAYQMLTGSTPFRGDFTAVMDAHRLTPPPAIEAKGVRKKLKLVITSALAKEAEQRPQTAEAFASILRSRSEGIFGLLRRSLTIYTEHLPKFVNIALLLNIPYFILTFLSFSTGAFFLEVPTGSYLKVASTAGLSVVTVLTSIFCAHLAVGSTTWMVNQILSYPLRPVRVRPALMAVSQNWKRLIWTGILSTMLMVIGWVLFVVPGIMVQVLFALTAPVVMMEGLSGMAALRRSKVLTMRSLKTTAAAVAIMFLFPISIGIVTNTLVGLSISALADDNDSAAAQQSVSSKGSDAGAADSHGGLRMKVSGDDDATGVQPANASYLPRNVRRYLSDAISTFLMLPIQVFIISISSIIVSLLYIKTRMAGGESMSDLLANFEETGRPLTKWQSRVRQRLVRSGRSSGRT